jgi:hypothetical protein
MRRALSCIFVSIALGLVGLAGDPAGAATASGPYYATPSWDQTLPASTRFIVLSNFNGEAVLDRETGLVWERSPSTIQRNWLNAQDSCPSREVGGRLGWRLPTVQELASLADRTQSDPTLPAGHPFDVQSSFYWSATPSAAHSGDAWVVYFGDGDVFTSSPANTLYVWCVRGGPAAP